jgi:hypothetical protein
MERDHLDVLFALGDKGCDLIWGVMQREREAWVEKHQSWERERALLIKTQEMIEEREAIAIAVLQRQVDVAHGHITVRTVLEKIGKAEHPKMNATDALNHICDDPKFVAYMEVVSKATHLSARDLLKSAKGAYSALSSTLHSGSTITKAGDVVPEDVMHDKLMLHAVAALFKYARRDVRFYLDVPANELKLPSPARTPPSSSGPSAAPSPPKAAALIDAAAAGVDATAVEPAAFAMAADTS